jgi:hypothetical protein
MSSVPSKEQLCCECGERLCIEHYSYCRECLNKAKSERSRINKEIAQQQPCYRCGNKPRVKDSAYCYECLRTRQRMSERKRYAKSVNFREKGRNDNLKRMYGITMEVYDWMLVQQRGVCAICGQAETRKSRNGTVQPLSVDHNHVTGRIRGLLCHDCNWLVGAMELNPKIIQEAQLYLQKHLSSND